MEIKEKLIHLLGGHTQQELSVAELNSYKQGRRMAINVVLCKMDNCYGMQPDDWCKEVYNFTVDAWLRYK